MKEIKLTKGKIALVDDEDYDFLMQWKWCANENYNTFYARRTIHINGGKRRKTKAEWMHRLIMKPKDGLYIDHINKNGLDNRKCNLKIVTLRENFWNKSNQAEFIGAYKHRNKYKSTIKINSEHIYLGLFKTPAEAHKAYMDAALKQIEYEKS